MAPGERDQQLPSGPLGDYVPLLLCVLQAGEVIKDGSFTQKNKQEDSLTQKFMMIINILMIMFQNKLQYEASRVMVYMGV